jgi:hypothetical protein
MRGWPIIVVLTAITSVSGSHVWKQTGQLQQSATSVTTGIAEGEIWLKWDARTRLGFVRGYLIGLGVGNRNGCSSYAQLANATTSLAEMPIAKCLANVPKFSRPPEEYASAMTRFYQAYPKDVGLNLESLLWLLSDNQTKTPEQVDAWFRAHGGSPQS